MTLSATMIGPNWNQTPLLILTLTGKNIQRIQHFHNRSTFTFQSCGFGSRNPQLRQENEGPRTKEVE